jgi:hypothetical protein
MENETFATNPPRITHNVVIDIDNLKPWDKNPRKTTDNDLKRLREQVQRLGQYKPLLVTEDHIVIGGNQRLSVLKEMGRETANCTVVYCEQNEAKMLEYALSDNDHVGHYDGDKLTDLVHPLADQIPLQHYHLDVAPPLALNTVIAANLDNTTPSQPEEEGTSNDPNIGNFKAKFVGSPERLFNIIRMLKTIEEVSKSGQARTVSLQIDAGVNVKVRVDENYESIQPMDLAEFQEQNLIFSLE